MKIFTIVEVSCGKEERDVFVCGGMLITQKPVIGSAEFRNLLRNVPEGREITCFCDFYGFLDNSDKKEIARADFLKEISRDLCGAKKHSRLLGAGSFSFILDNKNFRSETNEGIQEAIDVVPC